MPIFILFIVIVSMVNGCRTQNTVTSSPPSTSDIYSIKCSTEGESIRVAISITRDSIVYQGGFPNVPPVSIDTAIADSQELDSLLQTFDIGAFWSLEDRVNQSDIMRDIPLQTITITASSNNSTIATQPTERIVKVLQYTGRPYEQQFDALMARMSYLLDRRVTTIQKR